MKFIKYISCAVLGHYWVFNKKIKEDRKQSTFRAGMVSSVTYQGKPVYYEVEFNIWQCKYCKISCKTDLEITPDNSKRARFRALFKKQSWVDLYNILWPK